MSLPFSCFFSILLTIIHGQRILDFTADSYDYPLGVRYLGCDVDESTDEIYCIGGWSSNGDVYRYVGDGEGNETGNVTGWQQITDGKFSSLDIKYVFNAEIIDGVLYFVSNQGNILSSYDLDTDVLTTNLLTLNAGSFAETAAVNGNILYITCGTSTAVVAYDTSTGTVIGNWNSQSSHGLGTAKFFDDTLYLLGGRSTTTNKLEYSDVNTINWVTSNQADNVPDDFDYLTSVVTPEGYIYAIGGQDNSGTRDEILLYNIGIDRVRTIAVTFPTPVYGSDCVIFREAIWCMGGSNTNFINTVYVSNDLTPGGKGKGV